MPLAPKSPASASRLPLLALALASFGIGTTEFVIMGLLPDVAGDLGVTIPQAGLLVTGYALSVAFGSPFLAVATARMDRRKALLLLIGIFILGNLLCALAPNYALLMAARIVTALCHSAFFGLGAVVAATLVPEQKRAQAIAMMFAGLTLANVLGVPFGTALGEAVGWRNTFWAVVVIGFAAAFALYTWLPRNLPTPRMKLIHEARSLGSTQVILAMLISVVVSASLFGVFTYITPILENVTLISPHAVTLMLLLFGIGLTAGNFLGGWLGDWKLVGDRHSGVANSGLEPIHAHERIAGAGGRDDLLLGSAGLRADISIADARRQRGSAGAQSRLYPQSGCIQPWQRGRRLDRRSRPY